MLLSETRRYLTDKTVRLVGGRHRVDGRIVFPLPRDSDGSWEAIELPTRGRVWSYTVQRFRPKTPPYAGPEAFAPYAVAYVDLEGQLLVESRLTDVDLDSLEIGMPVELTLEALHQDEPNDTVHMMHAFRAVEPDQTVD